MESNESNSPIIPIPHFSIREINKAKNPFARMENRRNRHWDSIGASGNSEGHLIRLAKTVNESLHRSVSSEQKLNHLEKITQRGLRRNSNEGGKGGKPKTLFDFFKGKLSENNPRIHEEKGREKIKEIGSLWEENEMKKGKNGQNTMKRPFGEVKGDRENTSELVNGSEKKGRKKINGGVVKEMRRIVIDENK